jgi:hypothetical protein
LLHGVGVHLRLPTGMAVWLWEVREEGGWRCAPPTT